MAELLIKAVDATHSNPDKDKACYKQGDVVIVQEDGFTWGNKELKPPAEGGKFVVVQITGVTVAQLNTWCQNNWGILAEHAELGERDEITRRRSIRIDVDLLPNNVRNILNRDGFYANTWANIRSYFRNKITDTTGSGSI